MIGDVIGDELHYQLLQEVLRMFDERTRDIRSRLRDYEDRAGVARSRSASEPVRMIAVPDALWSEVIDWLGSRGLCANVMAERDGVAPKVMYHLTASAG
jgi:hypothetical protein